jgi:hypothetical protein
MALVLDFVCCIWLSYGLLFENIAGVSLVMIISIILLAFAVRTIRLIN